MKYVRTKEQAVRRAIDKHFRGFLHDKKWIDDGCDCTTRRRIDHRLELGMTTIAIETDEFAHRYYDKEDEVIRYHDIFCKSTTKYIWLRFNPDGGELNLKRKLDFLVKLIRSSIVRAKAEKNEDLLELNFLFYPKDSKHLTENATLYTEDNYRDFVGEVDDDDSLEYSDDEDTFDSDDEDDFDPVEEPNNGASSSRPSVPGASSASSPY